jgi:hypothetical protein
MNPEEKSTERINRLQTAKRIILWGLIVVYTYNLPNARVVYNFLVETVGQEITGRVPLVMVTAVGLLYALLLLLSHRSIKNLLFLIPCGMIAYAVITLEPNPNKHIHIPEYVLMAWLLFTVLAMDYKSADILLLVFLLTSMLGVVDELEQGIHPARFYGYSDMLVNSASALIGVFTIMGLKKTDPIDLSWVKNLRKEKPIVLLILFALVETTISCVYLFRVQAAGAFRGVYPGWLSLTDLVIALLVIYALYRIFTMKNGKEPASIKDMNRFRKGKKLFKLWLSPILAILLYMKILLIYVSASGIPFE